MGTKRQLYLGLQRDYKRLQSSAGTTKDCKALQRVVRLAERISRSALPSLQDIYLKRCKNRAAKIIKNTNHPGFHSTAIWQALPDYDGKN